ncbi:MAG: dihydrofolate reductase [Candidatus Portnoybacteria bacterium]|nr:dihydrofolate reductase [Candidatus Portnoybacteria bacterium]
MKVILLMAMTVNGKIARTRNELVKWTSTEDKKQFRTVTKKAGALIMGKTTYDTIGKPLPERLNIVLTRNLQKMRSIPGTLEFTNKPLRELLLDLERRGFASVIVSGGSIVNAQFLREGLLDEIIITVAPKIFGKGVPLFADEDYEQDLALQGIKKINNNTITLRYKITKKHGDS